MPLPIGDQNPRRTAQHHAQQYLQSVMQPQQWSNEPLLASLGQDHSNWLDFLNPNSPARSVPWSTEPLLTGLTGGLSTQGDNIPGLRNANNPVANALGHQQTNPMEIALAQLSNLVNQGTGLGPAPSDADLQDALDKAAQGIQEQFGGQISAIQHQNQGARQDVAEGSAKVQDMYRALAKSFDRAGTREIRQGRHVSKQLGRIGEHQHEHLEHEGEHITDQSNAAYNLGLGNLAHELEHQTEHKVDELGGRAERRADMAARTALGSSQNDRAFMQQSGQASRLEGTNRSADMYAQLQDYLQQNRDAIASLAGERQAAIAQAQAGIQSSFADASSAYQDQAMQARQAQIDNNMELLKLAMEARDQQAQGGSGGGGGGKLEKFYEMLPDQISGPSMLLNKFKDPQVTNLYEQLSAAPSMQNGFTGSPDQPRTLVDNYANMQNWLKQKLGDAKYASLSEVQRRELAAVLLKQLSGM